MNKLLASAALLSLAATIAVTSAQAEDVSKEKCYGIAKAGKNDCASGSEACAGQSKADNAKNAWVGLAKGTCDKIVGGSTTEGSAT